MTWPRPQARWCLPVDVPRSPTIPPPVTRRRFLGRLGIVAAGALLAPPLRLPAAAEGALPPAPARLDLLTVTPETFIPHIGTPFGLAAAHGPDLVATLTEVDAASASPAAVPRSFSLAFEAAPGHPSGQGTYAVRHPRLGRFDLFVVPVGRPGPVRTYQAVISHL